MSIKSLLCTLASGLLLTTIICHAAPPAMPPTAVSAATAVAITWQPSIKETGSLIAPQGGVVSAEADGRITQIFFHSGQAVKQGDPLIQLNPDVIKAQLQENEAELKKSHLAFDRAQDLIKKHYISRADYDQAEANFHSAQAKVAQSQALLEQTHITAPFNGRLGLRQVSIGDYVKAGQALVNLQTINPIYVNFTVPEKYIGQIRNGMQVQVNTSANPKTKFIGKVFAFESLIDVQTRTLAVRATLANDNNLLLPGEFVEVKLLLSEPQAVIKIPQVALVIKDSPTARSDDSVYVIKNGQVTLTAVTVVARQKDNVLISKGLIAGDQVVTAGQIKLQDKAPVTIVK